MGRASNYYYYDYYYYEGLGTDLRYYEPTANATFRVVWQLEWNENVYWLLSPQVSLPGQFIPPCANRLETLNTAIVFVLIVDKAPPTTAYLWGFSGIVAASTRMRAEARNHTGTLSCRADARAWGSVRLYARKQRTWRRSSSSSPSSRSPWKSGPTKPLPLTPFSCRAPSERAPGRASPAEHRDAASPQAKEHEHLRS